MPTIRGKGEHLPCAAGVAGLVQRGAQVVVLQLHPIEPDSPVPLWLLTGVHRGRQTAEMNRVRLPRDSLLTGLAQTVTTEDANRLQHAKAKRSVGLRLVADQPLLDQCRS